VAPRCLCPITTSRATMGSSRQMMPLGDAVCALSRRSVPQALWLGLVLSGHLTYIAVPANGQLGRRCTVAHYLHVLQVIMTPHGHTSCRPQWFIRVPWNRASGPWNHVSAPWEYTGTPFFMPASYGLQRTAGHMVTLEPSPSERRSPELYNA
jgi:hypothetical protein